MASNSEAPAKPFFADITAGDDDGNIPEVTELQSLCMSCEDQGTTRLLLTRIPFFKEVIVSSFSCDHCGYRNSELQPAAMIQDTGVRYTVTVITTKDLMRQVVQTDTATIQIPEIEFEIPPNKGALTTVEGILTKAVEGLEQFQPARKIQEPEVAEKIDKFLEKLRELLTVEKPFTMVLDDPSGNSFLENPNAPSMDRQMYVKQYTRTREQDASIGIQSDEISEQEQPGLETFKTKDEVLSFPTVCQSCQANIDTKMKVVEIPNFKEVVIMASNCDFCGYRENEVKGGAGIEPLGKKFILEITNVRDMTRDLLKSDTCSVSIPELDFEAAIGTLGGKFTTVEGLLVNFKEQLCELNPFFRGDSSHHDLVEKLKLFVSKIDEIIRGERLGVHLVIDDPAGNSYLQNFCAPNPDPHMEVIEYERNYDQNEELGLNDMKTENYES